MQNKVVIITGASDGIGAIAAKNLHAQGAEVIVVERSPEKTKKVAEALGAVYYIADFTDLSSVRALAAQLKNSYPKIDVLINNAGGLFGERALTVDGHERTFQVNHLAPFLLTNELIETLVKSKAVIINTSSAANRFFSELDIDDLELTKGYSANRAYGNSKLAKLLLGTPEKGAEPLVWLASSIPGTDWESGAYYEKHKLGKVHPVAAQPGIAKRLWEYSEAAVVSK